MRAADLIRQYRKTINPPYTSNELVIAVSLLFLLLIIPLTVISSQQARPLGIRAAATLIITPNPAECCGATFTASGSGYYPSSFAYINIHTPNTLYSTSVATDALGNMTFTHATAEVGTYTVEVFQYSPKGKKLVKMAEATFQVVESSTTGDINGDGVVNIFDASILASKWDTNDPDADLNGNGVVDIFDASILASNWEG